MNSIIDSYNDDKITKEDTNSEGDATSPLSLAGNSILDFFGGTVYILSVMMQIQINYIKKKYKETLKQFVPFKTFSSAIFT